MFHAYLKMHISFNLFFIFLYIHDCVLLKKFSPFLLDMVSIVAKITKFEQEYHILNEFFLSLKNKKSIASHINLRKMILKFHYY